MAYNFVPVTVTRPFCSHPMSATGCRPITWPGSSSTSSTSWTWARSWRLSGRWHGRATYQPRMLLAVLLYAYCTGIRSSRQIERRCHEDIAFRVPAGNSAPDHVTIARFRVRHEQALAGLLVAFGVAGGHAEPVAAERLAQRRPGGPQLGRGGVDAAEPLGKLEGAFGFAAVGQEAAGLPAQRVTIMPTSGLRSALWQ
jgi:Transposase domain (DUF772)